LGVSMSWMRFHATTNKPATKGSMSPVPAANTTSTTLVSSVWVGLAVLVLLLSPSLASSRNRLVAEDGRLEVADRADSWEGDPAHRPDDSTCSTVERALVVPVASSARGDAIARLETLPVIALDGAAAAKLLDPQEAAVRENASASELIRLAIARLGEQKRRQLDQHIGGWSLADQKRLDELKKLGSSSEISALQPFLVRAVAKNELTGGFVARLCSDALHITHWSLGNSTPPSIRLPVVVFLERAPRGVYADWGMAE